jgi:hypothetical protein
VLDNHTVELGAQDKDIALQVAKQGWKKLRLCSPRVRYKHRVTIVGKISLTATLCTWSPSEVTHLLYCHQEIFWHRCRGTSNWNSHNTVRPLLAPCNFSSLGRLHHCEFFLSFRFAKYFSLSYFCLSCYFCFSYLLLVLS